MEDVLGKQRRVGCSVSSFANLGALIDGTALLATIPRVVAGQIRAVRPQLRIAPLPFRLAGTGPELLWPAAVDDDPAGRFLRERITAIARRPEAQGRARSRPS